MVYIFMEKIKVHDKYFEPYIKHEKILEAVNNVAKKIMEDYKDKNPLFVSVLNGSFMFSSDLFKAYDYLAEICFIKLSSYHGTQSTEEVKTLIGLDEDVEGRDIIILEDIIDTGITVSNLVEDLKKYNPSSVKIATLLLKPKAMKTDIVPDYVGIEIPNDFIVGYGLDYDGLGRNLKDIYKIVD